MDAATRRGVLSARRDGGRVIVQARDDARDVAATCVWRARSGGRSTGRAAVVRRRPRRRSRGGRLDVRATRWRCNRLTRGVGDTCSTAPTASPGSASTSSGTTCRSTQISPYLQHAVVAIEDRRFYYHPGIDPIGLARAVLRQRAARRGASRAAAR